MCVNLKSNVQTLLHIQHIDRQLEVNMFLSTRDESSWVKRSQHSCLSSLPSLMSAKVYKGIRPRTNVTCLLAFGGNSPWSLTDAALTLPTTPAMWMVHWVHSYTTRHRTAP